MKKRERGEKEARVEMTSEHDVCSSAGGKEMCRGGRRQRSKRWEREDEEKAGCGGVRVEWKKCGREGVALSS